MVADLFNIFLPEQALALRTNPLYGWSVSSLFSFRWNQVSWTRRHLPKWPSRRNDTWSQAPHETFETGPAPPLLKHSGAHQFDLHPC